MSDREQFHARQYYVAAAIGLVCMIVATFGPVDRVSLAHDATLLAFSFIFGKFTNRFGQRGERDSGRREDRIPTGQKSERSSVSMKDTGVIRRGE